MFILNSDLDSPVVAGYLGNKCLIEIRHLDSNNTPEEDSLERYFGIVEAVVLLQNQCIIKLHGCDAEAYKFTEDQVEVSIIQ